MSNKVELVREYILLQGLKTLAYLFRCSFDGGVCANGAPNCCLYCAQNYGYLKFVNRDNLEVYKLTFSHSGGFWDKNRGCKLDPSLRSVTCITHFCEAARKVIPKNTMRGLTALASVMKELEASVARVELRDDK